MENRRELEDLPLYRIPEGNLLNLKERVTKMNRRAVKLGMEPLVLTERGEEFDLFASRDTMFDMAEIGRCIHWVFVKREEGETIEQAQERYRASLKAAWHPQFTLRRFVLVTVGGTLPRVNGWAMAATIQHGEDGNLLRTVPGFDQMLPLRFRTATTECEHCNTNRARKDTYVLQHEDLTWKQVGRNCLADFIRSTNAGAWADAAEMLASLDGELGGYESDDWMEGGSRGENYYSATALLTQVACCIRVDGWCSRTEAKNNYGKTATADIALGLFDPKIRGKLSTADQTKLEPTPEDHARATAAIEWAQSLATDVSNDYLWNIRVVSHREMLTRRECGLAGSIIAAYNRQLEYETKRKYERETTLDEYFGEIGKRSVFTLTVTAARDMDSDYGPMTLYKFRDADGRTAAWFSSNSAMLEIGTTYTVKATVKKHGFYGMLKQTTLSRVEVYDAVAEAAQKEALKAAKKRIKKEFTCTHESQQWRYPVACGMTTINVHCCKECQDAWVLRESATPEPVNAKGDN